MPRLTLRNFFGRVFSNRRLNQQRYDNLATYAERVLQHRYSYDGIRRALTAAHVLTNDGLVHILRIERLLRALGFKGNFPNKPIGWTAIAEGGS